MYYKSNIKFNMYHYQLMELVEKGYNYYILSSNDFTANIIFYKKKATLKYILKKIEKSLDLY